MTSPPQQQRIPLVDDEVFSSPAHNNSEHRVRVQRRATSGTGVGIETAPLVFIGVGGSLAVVGSVPLVVTLSLGVNSSATIIGVGFVGFGFLIIVPGIFWCLISNGLTQCQRYGAWSRGRRRHNRTLSTEQEVELLVLSDSAAHGAYTADLTIQATPTKTPPSAPVRTLSCDVLKTTRGPVATDACSDSELHDFDAQRLLLTSLNGQQLVKSASYTIGLVDVVR